MKMLNKKGQVKELTDFVIIFVLIILLAVFFGATLLGSTYKSEKSSLSKIADFKKSEAGINNLRVQMHQGIAIEVDEVEEKIAKSRVLAGRTITTCSDYTNTIDCNSDPINIVGKIENINCHWDDDNECVEMMKMT